jgi:hypothetical protein
MELIIPAAGYPSELDRGDDDPDQDEEDDQDLGDEQQPGHARMRLGDGVG